jgi:hypothetical protein
MGRSGGGDALDPEIILRSALGHFLSRIEHAARLDEQQLDLALRARPCLTTNISPAPMLTTPPSRNSIRN